MNDFNDLVLSKTDLIMCGLYKNMNTIDVSIHNDQIPGKVKIKGRTYFIKSVIDKKIDEKMQHSRKRVADLVRALEILSQNNLGFMYTVKDMVDMRVFNAAPAAYYAIHKNKLRAILKLDQVLVVHLRDLERYIKEQIQREELRCLVKLPGTSVFNLCSDKKKSSKTARSHQTDLPITNLLVSRPAQTDQNNASSKAPSFIANFLKKMGILAA